MRPGVLALASGIALPLAGCAVLQPKPIVENRFARASIQPAATDAIDLAVVSTKASGGGEAVKITELGDRAQAALIAATQGSPPVELEAEDDAGDPETSMESSLVRRVQVSLRPKEFLPPGDRVNAVRIAIAVAASQKDKWKITAWSQASNPDTIIEVGKVTDTRSAKLSASTGLNVTSVLPGASLAAEASRERVREMEIKDIGELNAAVDQSGTAWIDEIAAWRVNLARTRNTIDVILSALPGTSIAETYLKASKLWGNATPAGARVANVPGQVGLISKTRFVSEYDKGPICGTATLSYQMRHIINAAGPATFSESDDQVQFERGATGPVSFLLSPSPYKPLYEIVAGSLKLRFKDQASTVTDIKFASIEQAAQFRTWLISQLPSGGAIANGRIGLQDGIGDIRAIKPSDIRALMVAPANPKALDDVQKADLIGCPNS